MTKNEMTTGQTVPFWYIAAFAPLPIASVTGVILLLFSQSQEEWWFGPSFLVTFFLAMFLCRVFTIGLVRYLASRR